jgi:hypothetical protein
VPKPATRLQAVRNTLSKRAIATPDQETIAVRAYQLWLDGGCPHGRDKEDWYRAEVELKSEAGRVVSGILCK